VQLAGVPRPTTWFGCEVSTIWAAAGTAAWPAGFPGAFPGRLVLALALPLAVALGCGVPDADPLVVP